MAKTFIPAAFAMTAALILGVPTARADARPLEVDCSIVYATNLGVAQLLATNDIGVASLGELLAMANKDSFFFGLLSGLTAAVSGGEIYYSDIEQVIPTNARCGLMSQVTSFT